MLLVLLLIRMMKYFTDLFKDMGVINLFVIPISDSPSSFDVIRISEYGIVAREFMNHFPMGNPIGGLSVLVVL